MNRRNRKLLLNKCKDSCIPVWVYDLMLFQSQVSKNEDQWWNKGKENQENLAKAKPKISNNLISEMKMWRHGVKCGKVEERGHHSSRLG